MDLISSSPINLLAQFALGMLIMWVSRSLGRIMTSYRDDYQPIAPLFGEGGSVGFNAVYRVFFAPVAIVAASVGLYMLGFDTWVTGIWIAAVWFFLLDFALVLALGRWLLLPKMQYFLFHALSIGVAVLIYQTHISSGVQALLPRPEDVVTEIWILVLLFVYGVVAHVRPSRLAGGARRRRYIQRRVAFFRRKYAVVISDLDHRAEAVLLGLLVYEDFNRPRIVRWAERMLGGRTQGLTQTQGRRSDSEEIRLLGLRISAAGSLEWGVAGGQWFHDPRVFATISEHNPGSPGYAERIIEVVMEIEDS